jgi:Na+:H+ antiporter, NhaA family
MRAITSRISSIIHHDAFGGVLLMSAALAALVMDNSPLRWAYDAILTTPVIVQIGAGSIEKPLLLWVNDGLMAIFFFLVGMEIKREILEGQLSSWNQAALPIFAAAGGMLVPAAIYAIVNFDSPSTIDGWAIPAATDIAFALGLLALVGSRVPITLKIFLLALAILDDLGAIIIIAAFYTSDLSLVALAIAGACTFVLLAFNLLGVRRISLYVLVGMIMWVCVLKSGVHATLAGVIIALCIPLRGGNAGEQSPLHRLELGLHPWVAFLIMPAFAFANAGVALDGLRFSDLLAPVPLGIALGLFVGKQIGVFGFVWLAVRAGFSRLPDGTTWLQIYGISLLAGIGFTMSLFIGTLAFSDPGHAAAVRLGVLTGSILSGVLGFCVLKLATAAGSAPAPSSLESTSVTETGRR